MINKCRIEELRTLPRPLRAHVLPHPTKELRSFELVLQEACPLIAQGLPFGVADATRNPAASHKIARSDGIRREGLNHAKTFHTLTRQLASWVLRYQSDRRLARPLVDVKWFDGRFARTAAAKGDGRSAPVEICGRCHVEERRVIMMWRWRAVELLGLYVEDTIIS